MNTENQNEQKAEQSVDDMFAEMESDSAREGGMKDQSFDEPQDEVSKLKALLAESEKRTLLAKADLENFRRRTRRDTQEQVKYAAMPLMNELLEVVDNLQRAINTHESDSSSDGLVEGVKMVAQQIANLLENQGCKKIEAVGQPFDPNLHQAVQMQNSDEYDPNVVMQELRTGFQLHDRIIRPSQVFVSTGPATKE